MDTLPQAVVSGFLTGLALIVAVGAQNAFVLRQGLGRRHVPLVVVICAVSDLVLISAGIGGLAGLVLGRPVLVEVVRWVGVGFLTAYGVRSMWSARRAGSLDVHQRAASTRAMAATQALAFTFLNPHVYLDTVVMVGALANGHGAQGRWAFGAGAGTASIVWFSLLGFGSRRLAPLLTSPRAWQVLDLVIAVVMLALAAVLAVG